MATGCRCSAAVTRHRPAHVVWHAPGGGLEAHESWAAAAARELAEETGLVVPEADLGEPIWCRSVLFSFAGTTYAQRERYFLLAVEAPFLPDTAGFTAVERTLLTEHVWWDHDQLRACRRPPRPRPTWPTAWPISYATAGPPAA